MIVNDVEVAIERRELEEERERKRLNSMLFWRWVVDKYQTSHWTRWQPAEKYNWPPFACRSPSSLFLFGYLAICGQQRKKIILYHSFQCLISWNCIIINTKKRREEETEEGKKCCIHSIRTLASVEESTLNM